MEQNNKILMTVLVVLVLIVVAYTTGKNSSVVTTTSEQDPTTSSQISNSPQTQQQDDLPKTKPSDTTTADNLLAQNANALACKKIAEDEQKIMHTRLQKDIIPGSATLLKAHYNQSLGKCFYRLLANAPTNGSTDDVLMVAPNNDLVASCLTIADYTGGQPPTKTCGEYSAPGIKKIFESKPSLTDAEFQTVMDFYLTN